VRVELQSLHYGNPGAGPKATLQAALHADEIPGLLVAHHLRDRLAALEAAGRIVGEVVLVPVANPLGSPSAVAHAAGTFRAGERRELQSPLRRPVRDRGGACRRQARRGRAANVATIRAAIREAASAVPARSAVESLRRILLNLSADADVVLDLHCDSQAVIHLYTESSSWPQVEPLARLMGAQAVLIAEESGDHPFDEACSTLWPRLAARFGPAHADPARVRGGDGRTARRSRCLPRACRARRAGARRLPVLARRDRPRVGCPLPAPAAALRGDAAGRLPCP
jgi:predicted deacylase